jgi:hypothetical protein
MLLRLRVSTVCAAVLALAAIAPAQQVSDQLNQSPSIVQATLGAPGNPSFQLKAVITEGRDPTPIGHVGMSWVDSNKWRRTIESDDFSQTLVVNGDVVFQQDSDDYFPVALNTLVTAMVDPRPILDAHRPGDRLQTKANGASSESGIICFGPDKKLCVTNPDGLVEIVGTPGHSVAFTRYEDFKGMRVARVLTDTVGVGELYKAQITEIKELKNPDDSLFAVPQPTPEEKQIRSVVLSEAEFRTLALETHDIIWPQVLDGNTIGTAAFYISTDRSGKIREVLPVHTDNERSNDSVRNQLMKWTFKPAVKDGFPAQAQSILTFILNTRAWGPPDPLSDAEVRKLASNIVEPVIPPGLAPSGTIYTVRVAIDSDGNLIEAVPAEGIRGMFQPCYDAIRQWHFSPILEDGQPLPYRAEIKFQAP